MIKSFRILASDSRPILAETDEYLTETGVERCPRVFLTLPDSFLR